MAMTWAAPATAQTIVCPQVSEDLEKNKTEARRFYAMGVNFYGAKKYVQAAQSLECVISLVPFSLTARYKLAQSYDAYGKYSSAREHYNWVLNDLTEEAEPLKPEVRRRLAEIQNLPDAAAPAAELDSPEEKARLEAEEKAAREKAEREKAEREKAQAEERARVAQEEKNRLAAENAAAAKRLEQERLAGERMKRQVAQEREKIENQRREAEKKAARTRQEELRLERERARLDRERRTLAERERERERERDRGPGVATRWWFWTGVVATLALAGGATYTGLQVMDLNEKWRDENDPADRQSMLDLQRTTDYLIGGAALSAAILTIAILSYDPGRGTSLKSGVRFTALPSCGGVGCGLTLSWRF